MKLTGKKALITGGTVASVLPQPDFSLRRARRSPLPGRDQKTLDEAIAELGSRKQRDLTSGTLRFAKAFSFSSN